MVTRQCHMYCSQRKEVEDSQQSSHKEQVDALWSRLEAASEAHKQQVQQLQEKQQELVMQLEQRDADCAQVNEHLLQVPL
jgi:predicted transcriptional regulator